MPTTSVFFGIIIRMFYRDHNPPHFHAEYQGQNATFDFDGKLLEGEIDSRTAKSLIAATQTRTQRKLGENASEERIY
ncbi:MAG: DUF4160 domain-containing protein [Candidatus Binatia bacterium]